jgi:hypothetical protein
MRAAVRSLGLPAAPVAEVFGSAAAPSPWAWYAATPVGSWEFSLRNRVQIDPDSGTAKKDHLVLGEQAWAAQARFEVVQAGALPADRADTHVLVLRCAATAVHSLGAWRRRGLGWVGITPEDGPVSAEDVAKLLVLTGGGR